MNRTRERIVGFGLLLLAALAGPLGAQRLMVWGDDTWGQLSGAPQEEVKEVGSGGSVNGLALRSDRTPVLWGLGPIGPSSPIPEDLVGERFRTLALGRDNGVLIRLDGTLAAFGQSELIRAVPEGIYRSAAVASVHAVAIAKDGALAAWGADHPAPPNDSLTGLLNAPKGRPFKEVSARLFYSLALAEDGTLFGWGHAGQGANVLEGWTPTPEDPSILYIPDQTFKAIAAGNTHALAIQTDGTVTGWGNGAGGALEPPPNVRFKAVAAGWGFSIGLAVDGTLWGWGTPVFITVPFPTAQWTFASQGWTRYGDTETYFFPGERFQSIAAAAFHVMAITAGR